MPWTDPGPHAVPLIRERAEQWQRTNVHVEVESRTLDSGLWGVRIDAPNREAALIHCALEADRLKQADLYYVTQDMTALAVAAGTNPPKEPFRAARAPTEHGLIVFAAPVGSYDTGGGEDMPIVAMSWGPWNITDTPQADGRPYEWLGRTVDERAADGYRTYRLIEKTAGKTNGTWVTFYSPSLLPEMIGAQNGFMPPCIGGDNETILFEGSPFPEQTVHTGVLGWAAVLYTAWQLMGQEREATGGRLAASETLPRRKGQAKLDRAAGYPQGDVRIVDVHRTLRPSKAAADEDVRASSGRRAVKWSCRWPVAPYRRSQCLNPHAHAAGECTHEDRIVPPHIKGPAGKPLRTRQTVKVWSDQA